MNRRKIVMLLIALALILIGLGVIFINNNGKETSKKETNETEEEVDSSLQTKSLELERCYNDLCVSKIDIEYSGKTDSGTVDFSLENNGAVASGEGMLEITFDNSQGRRFYYYSLNPGDSVDIKISYEGQDLWDIKDYKLDLAAEE